jgi:hypothetical protein
MARARDGRFPAHGWLGLALVAVFWSVNWMLEDLRTHWAFFPLWLGYCLTVDGLAVLRRGTSLLTRGAAEYAALFVISAPVWWLFEAINLRTRNWVYVGREQFSDLEYALLATLSFSTVVPAVLGTAELVAGLGAVRRMKHRARTSSGGRTTRVMFAAGLVAFALLMLWPERFFPFVWLSVVLVLEPINVWLGNRSLTEWTREGDWRPVVALSVGAMICGLFWEMWNFWSYPKWTYRVPIFGFAHVFEMPLLGYLGYIPFSWELFAMVQLAFGLAGRRRTDYVSRGISIR